MKHFLFFLIVFSCCLNLLAINDEEDEDIVDSEEIPEFHFSNFSKNAQREAINKGYESFWNVKDKIAEAIEL